jgi:hypothetical protein
LVTLIAGAAALVWLAIGPSGRCWIKVPATVLACAAIIISGKLFIEQLWRPFLPCRCRKPCHPV